MLPTSPNQIRLVYAYNYGWIHEDGKRYLGYLYFLPGFGNRCNKTRLIVCACRTVGFGRFRRLRTENLHNFKSKKSRIDLWGVKLQHFGRTKKNESKFFDFFDLKFFHFHTNFNEKFWKFWDRKISIFLISQIFISNEFSMKILKIFENFRSQNFSNSRLWVALTFCLINIFW